MALAVALLIGLVAGAALGWRLHLRRAATRPVPHGAPDAAPAAGSDRSETTDAEPAASSVRGLKSGLDLVGDGVVVFDGDGRQVHANAAAGLLADARHEDTLIVAALERCVEGAATGQVTDEQIELFGPPPRHLTVTASPVVIGDAAAGVVAVVRDESRLRHLESVRSDFVANVSHELKTPVGALAILADTIAEVDDEAARDRLVSRLSDEAHRLGAVIDDLLELSAIERATVARTENRVEEMVTAVTARLAPLADERQMTMATDIDPVAVVMGDRRQLESAIANVVENAVKYSPVGEEVCVRSWVDDGWISLEVVDRGIGIPRSEHERIFDRFHRADRAHSQATGGTGLGLAIVRNVVRGHGGEVRVQSAEGQGSTFTLRFPPAAVSSPTQPRSRP